MFDIHERDYDPMQRVSRSQPCFACGKADWCMITSDGQRVHCRRRCDGATATLTDKNGEPYYLHVRDPLAAPVIRPRRAARPTEAKAESACDWQAEVARYVAALTPDAAAALAAALKLPAEALAALPLGWAAERGGAWTFPEYNAAGTVIGITRRFPDGHKLAIKGSARGLTLPAGWRDRGGPLLIVEGPSDTLAASFAGLAVVGRPSCTAGAADLTGLLSDWSRERPIIVVGENDAKPDGRWPGRDGAIRLAGELARALGRPVAWGLPPGDTKDVRAWLTAQPGEWGERGSSLLMHLDAAAVVTDPPETVEATVTDTPAQAGDDAEPWPTIDPAAYYGIAGETVLKSADDTEADPVAVLAQLLAACGNAIGRGPHFAADDPIYTNANVLIVGRTSKGRKGTSWGRVRQMMTAADPDWCSARVFTGGITSGQGLVYHVRDAMPTVGDREADPGIADKRLLAVEGEFASVLRQCRGRESTLPGMIRDLTDSGNHRSLARTRPYNCTGAHVSIVGHITFRELAETMTAGDLANGLLNRFLFVLAKRRCKLPTGGRAVALPNELRRLEWAIASARGAGPLTRTPSALDLWTEWYMGRDDEDDAPAAFDQATARAESHVMRLALIFALLDERREIDAPHIAAALAVWDYAEQSARIIFGTGRHTGPADALDNRLLVLLVQHPGGLTLTELQRVTGNNYLAARVKAALGRLEAASLAHRRRERTGRRGPEAERWHAGPGAASP